MGKYILNNKNRCKFDLAATNGEVIGNQAYSSETAAKNGIESVRKNAPIANIEDQTVEGYEEAKNPKFEIYEDKAGEFRFRLKARNGEAILASEGYKAKASAKNGIESVIKNSDSEIEDRTE